MSSTFGLVLDASRGTSSMPMVRENTFSDILQSLSKLLQLNNPDVRKQKQRNQKQHKIKNKNRIKIRKMHINL